MIGSKIILTCTMRVTKDRVQTRINEGRWTTIAKSTDPSGFSNEEREGMQRLIEKKRR